MPDAGTNDNFEDQAIRPLRALGRRLREYVVLEGLAAVTVACALATLAQILLDWLWHLPTDMRAALLAGAVVAIVWVVWRRIARPLAIPLGPAVVASLVERRFPQLGSLLISAVRFHRGEVGPPEANSPQLMDVVLRRAVTAFGTVRLAGVLNHRRARRSGGVALGVAAVFIVALFVAPQTMGIWFDRSVLLNDTPWPRKTRIVVDLPGGVLRGARGDDIEVSAQVPPGYQAPRQVEIVFTTSSGRTGRLLMIRVGGRGYRHTFTAAKEDFEFYLEGGDDRTDVFRAELADRPVVERATITVTPPAYTRMEQHDLPAGRRNAEVLLGGSITVHIETNKPVQRAVLMAGRVTVADAVPDADAWRVSVQPERSVTYHFQLVDGLGLENKRPIRFAIRVLKDHAPRIRLKAPGVGDMVTTDAVLALELELADDFGLASADLVYQIAREGEDEHSIAVRDLVPGARQHQDRLDLPVASLPAISGDSVTIFARAEDFDDITGPNVGSSAAIRLRIVSRDELLSELAQREQEYRRSFERAIEAQEEVRRILLTAVDRLTTGQTNRIGLGELGLAERRQRQIASQVNAVRRQFEQILTQMRVNRLATALVEQRLATGINEPLAQLAKRDLPLAADAIGRLARQNGDHLDGQEASKLDPQQVAVLELMRKALARMIKWEGFQETVTMLREVLRLQDELNKETVERIEQQAADIFGQE